LLQVSYSVVSLWRWYRRLWFFGAFWRWLPQSVQGDVASFLNNLVGFLLFRRTQLLSGVVSAAKH
jgi:hypothetical protein